MTLRAIRIYRKRNLSERCIATGENNSTAINVSAVPFKLYIIFHLELIPRSLVQFKRDQIIVAW